MTAAPASRRRPADILPVLKIAVGRWLGARTSLFAAALAFYALLSFAPALLVVLSLAGRLLGDQTARDSLAEVAVRFAGPGADRVASTLVGMMPPSHWNTTRTLVGLGLLLYFSSSFFRHLRAALDSVWGAKGKGFGRAVLAYALSLGETLVAVSAAIAILAWGMVRSVVRPMMAQRGAESALAWAAWTRLGTLAMTFALVWAVLRYIPSVRPRPRRTAVVAGAVPAALALSVASELFATIIGRSAVASLYGAAGSLIMFLLWVYYCAWIVLFGAEVCRAWDEARVPG